MVIRQGDKDPFIRNIFTLNTCSQIVGSQVISYMKEDEMLTAWANFVREVDPDIITGFALKKYFSKEFCLIAINNLFKVQCAKL